MKLIPNFINPKNSSNAEKKLFKLFEDSKDLDDWICLHSLGLSNHITKREGEIDFLLIGPLGIFVIEVKGGRIERKNGGWFFTDKFGRVNRKNESPFNQAKTALYSLRSDITERFGHDLYSSVFGYGVMFPDITFTQESPEWSSEIIYDKRDLRESLLDYVNRLVGHWQSKQKSKKRLDGKQIKEITSYLRGDFELVKSISASVDESEQEIIDITEEQYVLLDSLELNPRTVFIGSAGTGKTLLAIEKAKRNAYRNVNTLFLCYNRMLADYLSDLLNKELGDLSRMVEVSSLHSKMYALIKSAGNLNKLNSTDNSKLYDHIYPEEVMKIEKLEQYDEIIIDEAQDILTDEYTSVLDRLLIRGLNNGKWLMCMDLENQDIYQRNEKQAIDRLLSSASSFKLTINCRNTRSIARQATLISKIDAGTTVKAFGSPVKYIWYKDNSEQSEKISNEINKLIDDGIKPHEITLLSTSKLRGSIAGSGRLRVKAPLYNIDTRQNSITINDHIGYSTIAAFKGLENKVIILTDIRDIGEVSNILNYVGFTRARSHLVVSLPRELKNTLNDRVSSIMSIGE